MEDKSLTLSTSLSRQETLHLEVFTDFDKLPPWPSALMVMASLEAQCESNEDRRAPVTLCAVIDRRWVGVLVRFAVGVVLVPSPGGRGQLSCASGQDCIDIKFCCTFAAGACRLT